MRIAVTGGAGMLATDLRRAAERSGHEVVALTHTELDVTDAEAALRAVAATGADAVVNCAAYTNVDGAESNRDVAFAVNARGASNVAAAAAAAGARIVYPSTDYVFDGERKTPYVESDPPGPRSVYGRSKLEGERATEAANPRHHIVRTSWLFGAGGPNFVETMLALASEREHLRVVDDQVGCPTHTAQLADALLEICAGDHFGVRHVAGGGACSWYDFAVEIFLQAGVDCEVAACTTAEFPRPAPRPAYSALASELPGTPRLPDWRRGLADYLALRAPAR